MPTRPSTYNRVNGDKVRYVCECGWGTPWRKAGARPPKYVFFIPFHCPKCGKECSTNTCYDGKGVLVPVT